MVNKLDDRIEKIFYFEKLKVKSIDDALRLAKLDGVVPQNSYIDSKGGEYAVFSSADNYLSSLRVSKSSITFNPCSENEVRYILR